ncbi:alpha/beta hydrolase family protein [Nocardia australiensis]|uniref:alpha/beta hydrolase family protein n=1 Tax=Nocardia australiensis TaxID=2887191 RepID=UPI001D14BDCA|nr:lipase family protein [Nocardia australiensis]
MTDSPQHSADRVARRVPKPLTQGVVAVLVSVASMLGIPGGLARADGLENPPAGLEFYTPSDDLVPGTHGSVIWERPLTGAPVLPGARNSLVLYRSVDSQGRPVAVSGTVAVPEGEAPPDGWPLISWAHGTTGLADDCAPSRDTGPEYSAHDYTALVRDIQARWIAAGYAVVQTDYQGLGTPGPHGYLIGEAEQRAVADIALAARRIEPAIGRRWLAMGHSQGGQAAIFADARAPQWAPDMELVGSVALAPASHTGVGIQAMALAAGAGVTPLLGSISATTTSFLPLLIRGAQTVADIDPARFLAPPALALLPQADENCIAELRAPNSWGGLGADQVFAAHGDAFALTRVLDENDPRHLRFGPPLLVQQGRKDTTVQPLSTDAMVAQLRGTGAPVDYRNYPDADHRSVIEAAFTDSLAWVDARFGRTSR